MTVVAVGALGACGGGGEADEAREAPDGAVVDEGGGGCAPDLRGALDAWGEAGFSGSIAVASGGEVECLAAYGSGDGDGDALGPDTVFSIGSISKAFTAAAVLDLVDAERLSLSDRAGDLVTGLDGPAADVTVEQLLLHTSGLAESHGHDHEPLGRDEAVAAIGAMTPAFEPGTDYLYSNAGYTLLALVVEGASGRDYRDHLAAEVLALPGGGSAGGFWDGEPAAPGPRAVGHLDEGPSDQTGDFAGPHWALTGNGDLAMTMGDLASWAHALLTGQAVSPGAVEQLDRLRFDHGDGTAEAPGWVAVGAEAYGQPFLTASGGGGDIGHEAAVVWLPEGERVVAIASNTPDVAAGELLRALAPALVAGDPLPEPEVVGDVSPADAEAVAGTYEAGAGGSFRVAGRGDRLAVSATGAEEVAALFPPPDDVTPDDMAAHERAVTALLAGETPAGRDERAALEADLGPIGEVAVAGTVMDGGELRTYVTVDAASGPLLAWYALDDQGGVAGVLLGAEPPTLLLGREDGGYRPDDPAGAGPDLTVTFESDRMTITGPAGATTARRAG